MEMLITPVWSLHIVYMYYLTVLHKYVQSIKSFLTISHNVPT